jgi:hypothetical protein
MLVQLRNYAVSLSFSAAVMALAACEAGEDNDDVTTVDSAVGAGEAGVLPQWDAGSGAPGAPGGTTGGGTTGGGATAGGTIGGGALDAGATPGGGAEAGMRDAAVPRDTGVVDTGVVVPVGDGGDFEAVRQVCLDTINMYRATLSLPPLTRANATLEACSDMGAKYDGDLKEGHASTKIPGKGFNGGPGRLCGSPPLGPQNTCPGYPIGRGTLADSLKRCLKQMWDEGEPAEGVAACKAAYFMNDTKCFLAHGHWINMADPKATQVSCGFYNMGNNTYWMNQDFVVVR